ncbi:MAG TPA: hypothetical protein VL691_05785 [Vicinamibacteria bacterium]|nr:hypothetical protein [Vicinamibacteria bacterium]
MSSKRKIHLTLSVAAAAALAACSSSSEKKSNPVCYGAATDGGGVIQSFQPPCDPGPKNILLTASGEVLALGGYDFPPASADAPAFVDGWEVRLTKLIVTFDHVRLNRNPDLSPTDESQVGSLVVQVNGPWAVDVHKGGPLEGKGGPDEQAVPIAAITGNFDPAQRLAFSFDTVAATPDAKNVNLDASDLTDYQDMITHGYTVLYVGTATWRGDAPGVTCTSTIPGYDFSKIPPVVDFRFGFAAPTSYINAQNPDNSPASPFPGEENQRGIAVKANTSTIAQATFHIDHPLWESFVHDSPIHFDQIAAQYASDTAATDPAPTATLDGMVGVDFSAFEDALGNALPWRNCVGDAYTPPPGDQMHFDNLSVPYVLGSSDPAAALRDYRDFMTYNLSTFGHLNSDGLAYVSRNYPSPQ